MTTKSERIRETLKETRERRKNLRPVVFRLKLQNVGRRRQADLSLAFLEAKWLYNRLVTNADSLAVPANKILVVEVKVGDAFEERPLTVLGSQIKQEIADRLKDNLKALKQLKDKGYMVGALKPKRFVNSIPLKQFGTTYNLDFEHNRVRIQKLGSFRVLGLRQIPGGAEIANAVLVRKQTGYYLHVACYVARDCFHGDSLDKDVGVDFGVGDKLVLSNGVKIDFEIGESRRLKTLQKKFAKKKQSSTTKKSSNNRAKTLDSIRREYEKLDNRRKDAQNKVLAFLRHYRVVAFQDDCVKGWTARFGRQVHASGIGGLKSRLKNSLETPVAVERFEPTTVECFVCGTRHEMSLSDRTFHCSCGYSCDRDVNAALVILKKGLAGLNTAVGPDWPELTSFEKALCTRILGSNPYIHVSMYELLQHKGSPSL